jgi:hypothetical protein
VFLGVVTLAAGLLLIVGGLLLWRDTRELLTSYYGRCVRAHRRLPFIGEVWIRRTPFSAFRAQTLAFVPGGVMLAAIGISVLVHPS